MNKRTAQGIANAFRAAKHRLWNGLGSTDGYRSVICFALGDGRSAGRAREIVMLRLSPHSTLTDWLYGQGVDMDVAPISALQAHRHAWLDRLIAEFDAKAKA